MLIVGAAVIAIAVVMQLIWPTGFPIQVAGGQSADKAAVSEIHADSPIRINELMSANARTLFDDAGATPDWVELFNVGSRDVDLAGYSLAKNDKASNVFTFPAHVLAPGECVVVYADSTLQNAAGADYHAPFKLSSQGGTLMLFSASGTAIDSVNFPALSEDTSYVRLDAASWGESSQPTPGLTNTEENYRALTAMRTDTGVEITEIVASNTQYAPDSSGLFHDYFELHNASGAAVDLSGWFVSDSADDLTKWRLPDGFTLQPGEYRIVYASGLDRADASEPHANFGFSTEGESAVLADSRGRLVDRVDFDLLKDDQAWIKLSDGTWTTGTPSPNAAN